MLLSRKGSCVTADWVQGSGSDFNSQQDLLQTIYLWGQNTLCEMGLAVLPLIIHSSGKVAVLMQNQESNPG